MSEEDKSSPEKLWQLAESRSKIYGFLSSVYIEVPSRNFVKTLLGEGVSSFLSILPSDIGLPQEIEEGLEDIQRFIKTSSDQAVEEVHQSLSVDYTRLFRGIMPGYGPPPPYESVYREGRCWGESTVEVLKEYRCFGLTPGGTHSGEPPDYLQFELEFMRFLCTKEAEAWRIGDQEEALKLLSTQERFLGEHLIKWIHNFCENIRKYDTLGFYRGWADATEGWIHFDIHQINNLITETSSNVEGGTVIP